MIKKFLYIIFNCLYEFRMRKLAGHTELSSRLGAAKPILIDRSFKDTPFRKKRSYQNLLKRVEEGLILCVIYEPLGKFYIVPTDVAEKIRNDIRKVENVILFNDMSQQAFAVALNEILHERSFYSLSRKVGHSVFLLGESDILKILGRDFKPDFLVTVENIRGLDIVGRKGLVGLFSAATLNQKEVVLNLNPDQTIQSIILEAAPS